MDCRIGCGACCIAASINGPIPAMPEGKPAGVRCVQLDADNRCKLFGHPERPLACQNFQPERTVCGNSTDEALQLIAALELATL